MDYHKLSKKEILKELNTKEEGLSSEEVNTRLLKYGENILPKKKKDTLLKIFFKQILNPLIILLIITVVFCFLIGETIDAVAILFIISLNISLGAIQEWKAGKNAESLENLIKDSITVLRKNQSIDVDSKELVPGDIVLLESGDKVSADMRVIQSQNLQIDESILTGESVAVTKQDTILNDVSLAERKNMVYAGTTVVTGRGTCIVIGTASDTEIGSIAATVATTEETKSPLTIRMEKFSKQISILVIFVALIIGCILLYKGVEGSEIFLSVIALSVSAMPEGLPLALTTVLTIASNKMSKKNVIVKKLNAVESLGSCTVIASDKTGTLTIDEQTAKKIVLVDGTTFEIDGIGYNDEGSIIGNSDKLEQAKQISLMGFINNEGTLAKENNKFISSGDSIDIAFLTLGLKAKINKENIKITKQIPYESENKYSAVFYEENNQSFGTVKGSIEKALEFCNQSNLDVNNIMKQNEDLAKQGYRVIAIASGPCQNTLENLTFNGLVGFIDPIRKEAKASINECHEAGIKVVMITGDHPLTAFTIAKELNLVTNYSEVATDKDIDEALAKDEKSFDEFVKSKKVFTRVSPINKLKIVESYKRQQEFIAVTGDGVNDAPALRSANIGIAMGSGTDVAKDTASMIIVDDNFKSIVAGIKEGRTAYNNIRKVSYMLLSCGLAEVLFFVLSIMCNLPMPLVAIQLLWLNIVTDGFQDIALAFEKSEDGIMKQKPRKTKESIFNKELLSETLVAGLAIGLIVFVVWSYLINVMHMDIDLARGYIMVLMVFMQNIHVFNCRSERESTFKISLKKNPLIIASILICLTLQVIIMEVPVLSSFLKAESVPLVDMGILLLLSLIILVVMEVYKIIKYRKA